MFDRIPVNNLGRTTLAAERINRNDVRAFAEAILHGDAEHRQWLHEAADAWCNGHKPPPARNAHGVMQGAPAEVIRDIPHWNKVGPGVPLGIKIETMHQDEYIAPLYGYPEQRVNLCQARILLFGDEIEWMDSQGYTTLMNPGSFKPPTHWRWQNGSAGT